MLMPRVEQLSDDFQEQPPPVGGIAAGIERTARYPSKTVFERFTILFAGKSL
jgi:hypothetical protein